MSKYDKIKNLSESEFKRLTGVKKQTFNKMIAILSEKEAKKSSKKKPLTKEDKKNNQKISSERVLNENVIGVIKRFRIVNDKYRNRRKRFGLRLNLICGIYNYEIGLL